MCSGVLGIIDLEKIIKACALKNLRMDPPEELSFAERVFMGSALTLNLDKASVGTSTAGEMMITPVEGVDYGNENFPYDVDCRTTELEHSVFKNSTDSAKSFRFKADKETTSLLELWMSTGFLLGNELDANVELPSEIPQCEMMIAPDSKRLWHFERGKGTKAEEVLSWGTDSNIVVHPKSTGEGRLTVIERQLTADFVMPCKIYSLAKDKMIHVDVEYQSRLIDVVKLACIDVAHMASETLLVEDENATEIFAEITGRFHVICGVEKEMWLKEATLVVM